jgi:DNA replication protein DnaC
MEAHALTDQLRKLRLPGILETMSIRTKQAQQEGLSHQEWLSLLLQDEQQRRDNLALQRRLSMAKFEQVQTFEGMELSAYPVSMQHRIRDLMCGHYLNQKEHVIIMGPTGTGKTHLAQALGNNACRQGKTVRFIRASVLLRELNISRSDNQWQRTFKKFSAVDLLIIDDFGLAEMTPVQAEEVYEIIAERHLKGSFIFTSNRNIDAWVNLFPEPIMGNAVLDRLANKATQLVLEGESYRRKTRPGINENKEVDNANN